MNGVFELVENGTLDPKGIDWWVTHYSSHLFREQACELFARGGMPFPQDQIFTNLYERGNVGSAAFPLMIEELLSSGRLTPGQWLLCIVPESGRFLFGYVILKVVEPTSSDPKVAMAAPSVASARTPELSAAPDIKTSGAPIEEHLVQRLSGVWCDFENRLVQVPIIRKMYESRMTRDDYRQLLFNLRQQVIDGSRWISRAASNLTSENFPIRSAFIGHSSDEHRDFEMIERDYASPYANYLIMRHFHMASELLQFVAVNTQGVNMKLNPLRPEKLRDLVDDVFLKHDLNIYNFIIEINRQLNEQGLELAPQETLSFDCITDGKFPIERMLDRENARSLAELPRS